jgi:hypothetical protein
MDVTAVTEETLSINENINVENKPDIEAVVKSVVKVNISEQKSIDDKIMVKGEVNLRLLYLSDLDSGEAQCLDYVVPFNQVISCVGADTSTVNDISCNLLSWDIKTTKDTEEKSILLEARINLTAVCYKERKDSFLTDAYSREFMCDLKKRSIPLITSVRSVKGNFIRKMEIAYNDKSFSKVIDTYNESCSVTANEENGCLVFSGKAGLCVVALDSEGVPFYIERTLDFTHKTDESFGIVQSINANVSSVSYRIKDEHTLELRVEISVGAFLTTSETGSFIEDIIVYDDKKIEKCNSALTLYFADKDEKLWDIAKHYYTQVDFIQQDNDIEGDSLPEKEMLIIRR